MLERLKAPKLLCPKFLHTNSTSHTWPFSAIAELIDNAFDPDVSAKHFWIDKTVIQGEDCLIFMDSGNGLETETMHKMLSFGYSDKTAVKGVKPIGMYGNGFKSGSMRLGRDAIVFSKSKRTSCVGMLSQTYLEAIGAKQVVVPIVCFQQNGTDKISVSDEQQTSLKDILTYSPFKTKEELLVEISAISSAWSTSKTGSRIIIWNLRKTSTGTTEFDFETDRYDIRIPSDFYEPMNENDPQPGRISSHVPESFYSLRAYCSILYLKPRMQIIIRGQKVKSVLISKSLAFVRKDTYKPAFLNNKPIPITFGYNTKSKEQYGVMMYHKNRLIKAYERVGCQLKANNKGVGVIGIIECGHFLEPTHNKQSFNETDKYRKTITNLGIKLEEYWQEIRHKKQREDPNNNIPIEDADKRPDQNWVQCNDCSRWRKLPDGIDPSLLPEEWFCRLNPDPQFRSCNAEEEPEDSDDEQPTYRKTYKQHERATRQIEERKRRKEEEERKRQEAQRLADLAKENQALMQQKKNLERELQLREKIVQSPSYSPAQRTPRGRAATGSSPSLRTSVVSQSACGSPDVSGLPVITGVCSLSAGHLRRKRATNSPLTTTPKRPRENDIRQPSLATSISLDVGPQSPPPAPPLNDGDDSDETDDDIFILETASTPKPKIESYDLTKVKEEKEQSDANVNLLLECNDDAALDDAMETHDAGTSSVTVRANPTPACLPNHANITTQTEAPGVKNEEESQNQTKQEESTGESVSNGDSKEENGNVKVEVCSTEENHPVNGDSAGPSCADALRESPVYFPSITEVQEQQDQLLELMQSTAQERDSLKEQVHKLTCELRDTQDRLQELTQITVKKESCHQAVQTQEREEENRYKNLFEKAKQKVDELIRDKESLLTAAETKPSTTHKQEQDLDEIAVHVDSLLRELDQRNKERTEMLSRLDSLEEERANLASQCEELKMSLQQQRDNAQERGIPPCRASESSVQTDQEDQGQTDSRSDTSRSLIELRHNIGRLLLTYVPALDLGQVNYECNVIDEILEQVLCEQGLNANLSIP
ncbi:MORC family CW-type zinc finger protein 3a isoform X2 [Halichoeres trimaculatus]|uniref:MORC family CW-type zinc finger protein 3a isoform X2 n=1 Tax=Halichoeres trimaculatus TaxID=147232 RepID=UPI003D9E4099